MHLIQHVIAVLAIVSNLTSNEWISRLQATPCGWKKRKKNEQTIFFKAWYFCTNLQKNCICDWETLISSHVSLYLNFSVVLPLSTSGVEGLLGLELKRKLFIWTGSTIEMKKTQYAFAQNENPATPSQGNVTSKMSCIVARDKIESGFCGF